MTSLYYAYAFIFGLMVGSFLNVVIHRLPRGESVDLRIYDVTGRLVRTLLDGEQRDAGYHLEMWNGTNDGGRRVASGIYFSRLVAGEDVRSQKMVLMK